MMFHDHLDLRYSGYNVYIVLFQAPNSMIWIVLFFFLTVSYTIFLIRNIAMFQAPFHAFHDPPESGRPFVPS